MQFLKSAQKSSEARGLLDVFDQELWTDKKCYRVPLVSQDIHDNRAVGIDVWVVDLGQEADLGGLEWVIGGQRDGEEEDATSIRRITLDHANSR